MLHVILTSDRFAYRTTCVLFKLPSSKQAQFSYRRPHNFSSEGAIIGKTYIFPKAYLTPKLVEEQRKANFPRGKHNYSTH
ncbi:unnamed protein product [Acanthoscelides obtectus]|uniref:Uncharacterized protein n=1 Tax=Acanthoscelides obtectus TaxID=200917 RepID=A0A9P0JM30_ACAOB|nr:unnamed protein product [Acanthoscelides obtectus]CAK1624927.1 hypothetical protein AOBTE_LOCUS2854 [Acanthoscelides obtectus]